MHVPFTSLSSGTATQILDLSAPSHTQRLKIDGDDRLEALSIPDKVDEFTIGLIGLAFLVGVVYFAITSEGPWLRDHALFALAMTLLGLPVSIVGVTGVVRRIRSRTTPRVLLTPTCVARVGFDGDPVTLHYLSDLIEPRSTVHLQNGNHDRTTFELRFRDGTIAFTTSDRDASDALSQYLVYVRELAARVSSDPDLGRALEKLDWVAECRSRGTDAAAPPANRERRQALVVALVVLVGVPAFTAGAVLLNLAMHGGVGPGIKRIIEGGRD